MHGAGTFGGFRIFHAQFGNGFQVPLTGVRARTSGIDRGGNSVQSQLSVTGEREERECILIAKDWSGVIVEIRSKSSKKKKKKGQQRRCHDWNVGPASRLPHHQIPRVQSGDRESKWPATETGRLQREREREIEREMKSVHVRGCEKRRGRGTTEKGYSAGESETDRGISFLIAIVPSLFSSAKFFASTFPVDPGAGRLTQKTHAESCNYFKT